MISIKNLFFVAFLLFGCDEFKKPEKIEQSIDDKSMCYDVINSHNGINQFPIMIDKCKGYTWILIKTTIPNKAGSTGMQDYVYRWYEVRSQTDEVVLTGY